MDDEFPAPYNIEFLEIGIWDSIDMTEDLLSALYIASSLCNMYQEDKIRIMADNGRII